MGEIKFDIGRMKQLLMRLDEIEEQLGRSCHNSSENMKTIYSNITGERILVVLLRYAGLVTEEVAKATVELKKLRIYLEEQIAQYSLTEQTAVNELSEVKGLLQTLQTEK